MEKDNIKIDVLDYLGKHQGGVLTLISISYDDKYYEATFFYTKEMIALTPDEKMEEDIKCEIEDWEFYNYTVRLIIDKIVPFDQIFNSIDEFNPDKYGLYMTQSDTDNNKPKQ